MSKRCHSLHPVVQVTTLTANGIRHRIRTNVQISSPSISLQDDDNDDDQSPQQRKNERNKSISSPLIMLLHGWPDSSFGWRHQLSLLSTLKIPVCAPDLRGFGGTSVGSSHDLRMDDYAVDVVANDVVDIAHTLGFETMVIVGHDFGAYLAWHLALLYPSNVVGVMALSIPYMGHVPVDQPPLAALQRRFGPCLPRSSSLNDASEITTDTPTRLDQIKARFHYILHHNLPHAHEKYNVNVREALYRIYAYQPGVECEDDDGQLVQDDRMFVPPFYSDDVDDNLQQQPTTTLTGAMLDGRSAPALWQRIPRPKTLPSWLSHAYLDIMVQDVQDWQIQQPCYFLIGDKDTLVINNHGGSLSLIQQRMRQHVVNLKKYIVVPMAGHWLPLECAGLVNQELLHFLRELTCYNLTEPSAATNNEDGDLDRLNRTRRLHMTSYQSKL